MTVFTEKQCFINFIFYEVVANPVIDHVITQSAYDVYIRYKLYMKTKGMCNGTTLCCSEFDSCILPTMTSHSEQGLPRSIAFFKNSAGTRQLSIQNGKFEAVDGLQLYGENC